MKILIAAESFLPRSNGVTNTVMRAANYLREHNHEVLIVAPGEGPEIIGDQRVVRVPAISFNTRVTIDIAAVTASRLREVIRGFKPDIVHLASPYLLGGQVRKAASYLGVPVVAVYQTDVSGFASFYGLGLIKGLAEKRIRKIHSSSDLNLAPSKSSIKFLNSLGVNNVKLWTRGVDHEIFSPKLRSDSLRKTWNAKRESFVIGFVGRLAPEKQVENLLALRGIESLFARDIKFVIIGDGPSKKKLSELLPNAIFAGYLSGRDLGRAMASLDLLITTGENETFCQVVQEAMAAAVPVIAPRSGGPIDLVKESITGKLYQPGNLRDLRRAVISMIVDPNAAAEMGMSGQREVQNRSWSNVCAELVVHYQNVLASLGLQEIA